MPDDIKVTPKQKEHLRKWVEALRSGDYKQAEGALSRGDSYCCLGVACDIYRKSAKRGKWITDEDGDIVFKIGKLE